MWQFIVVSTAVLNWIGLVISTVLIKLNKSIKGTAVENVDMYDMNRSDPNSVCSLWNAYTFFLNFYHLSTTSAYKATVHFFSCTVLSVSVRKKKTTCSKYTETYFDLCKLVFFSSCLTLCKARVRNISREYLLFCVL